MKQIAYTAVFKDIYFKYQSAAIPRVLIMFEFNSLLSQCSFITVSL